MINSILVNKKKRGLDTGQLRFAKGRSGKNKSIEKNKQTRLDKMVTGFARQKYADVVSRKQIYPSADRTKSLDDCCKISNSLTPKMQCKFQYLESTSF